MVFELRSSSHYSVDW